MKSIVSFGWEFEYWLLGVNISRWVVLGLLENHISGLFAIAQVVYFTLCCFMLNVA